MRPFSLIKNSFLVLILAAAQMPSAVAQTPAPIIHPRATRAPEPEPANWRAMFDKYCVTCHNERSKTGGLMLDRIDVARVADQAVIWEKGVRKLHAGAMPP